MLDHVISAQQLTPEISSALFEKADELRENPSEELKGKVLATLFYEPSTRTRLSFESAMLKLGGKVIRTENAKESSSATKGESIEDTIRVIGSYADCIVIRHSQEGIAMKAAAVSPVPIINAGDGKGQHPTQALLDIYTIQKELGTLQDLKIAMVGDLASGRTVRSLSYALGQFQRMGIEIIFVSPENLEMGEDVKNYLKEHDIKFVEEQDLDKVLPEVDIVYMTRTQQERMSAEDYEKAKGKYCINMDNLKLVKENARIMHPLPHVEEIDLPIDVEKTDKRVAYFRQAENGLYTRMALLSMLLKKN